MRRMLCAGLLLAAACAQDVTAPGGAITVHGVLITVAMPGRCLVGGCDPPGAGRTNLGLVTVLNTGTSTAYLEACGLQAAMEEQQFVNGQWVFADNPAISCPNTPGPITLAAGDSIQANWFFAAGLRRIVLGDAGAVNLSDESLGASAPIAVPCSIDLSWSHSLNCPVRLSPAGGRRGRVRSGSGSRDKPSTGIRPTRCEAFHSYEPSEYV